MKRILNLFLAFMMAISLFACGKEKPCDHQYETKSTKEATYYEDGEIVKVCIFCDHEEKEILSKLDLPLEVSVTDMKTSEQKRNPLVMPDGTEFPQLPTYLILFDIDVKNLTDYNIIGFKGTFTLVYGGQTLDLSFDYYKPIAAGETIHLSNYGFETSYNDRTMVDNMLARENIADLDIKYTLAEVIKQ